MMIRYERPVSRAARLGLRLAQFAVVLFLMALAAHRFGPLTTPHFVALALLSGALSLLAVLLALIGLVNLWRVAAVGGLAAVAALVFAALPLGAIGSALALYFTRPALHDVTSDTIDPPSFIDAPQAAQLWLSRPATVSPLDREAQIAAYPALTGRRYDGALDRVVQGVKTVAAAEGLTITADRGMEALEPDTPPVTGEPETSAPAVAGDAVPDDVPVPLRRPEPAAPVDLAAAALAGRPGDILLQGTWKTPIAGFRFDVAIRLREEAETTFVDIRVVSRYGSHDLGLGADFAERFLHALDAELLGIAGS